MTKFKLDLIPLRFSEYSGCLLMFGYPLFGGWLPYLGFQTMYDEEGNEVQIFLAEWFLRGIAVVSPNSKRNQDEE